MRSILFFLYIVLVASCSFQEARLAREKEASAHHKIGLAYLNEGALQKASIELQKAIDVDPNNSEILYALGHVYFQQENYPAAMQVFLNVLRHSPKRSDASNYLGRVYEVQGVFLKAIEAYQDALKNTQYETPEKPLFNLGRVYSQLGQWDEAISSYKEVVRWVPDYSDAHYNLAQAYLKVGATPLAKKAFEKVIVLAPQSEQADIARKWIESAQ